MRYFLSASLFNIAPTVFEISRAHSLSLVWAARADDNYHAGTVRIPCYVTVEYDVIFTYPLTLGPS